MNEFNSLERRAGLQTMQGMQQATIHTAMFMELLAAQHGGQRKARELLRRTFSARCAQGLRRMAGAEAF